MENVENTPRREDEIPVSQQGGQGNPQVQHGNVRQEKDGENANTQADQSSTYRGQGGEEYDVDAEDAVNRQADYSDNSGHAIETATPGSDPEPGPDTDIESRQDSDQNINPGDKAPNKDFNR